MGGGTMPLEFTIEIYSDGSSKLKDASGTEQKPEASNSKWKDPKGSDYKNCIENEYPNWTGIAEWGECSPICVWYNGSLYCT
jgi:hypothetical protein